MTHWLADWLTDWLKEEACSHKVFPNGRPKNELLSPQLHKIIIKSYFGKTEPEVSWPGGQQPLMYHILYFWKTIQTTESSANNPNTIKSYKILQLNYLQNTQHMLLRNRPTLSIGTERLACLNSPPGMQLGTLV